MTLLATSTFLQVLFAAMIVVPIMILWVAAVVDVLRQGGSGLKIAAMLVLILDRPDPRPDPVLRIRPARLGHGESRVTQPSRTRRGTAEPADR